MARPTKVTYTIKDNKGKTAFLSVWLKYDYPSIPSTSTLSQIESAAQYLATIIDPLISGQISNINYTRQVDLPGGLSGMAGSTSDVEEKGVFQFTTSQSNVDIVLPTFLDSLVVNGSQDIDQSDSDVIQFIFDITDGSGSPLEFTQPSDNRDTEISGFFDAYEQFKKS